MADTTKERLVTAAAQSLDDGGIEAMTLRGVAEKVGVSHNAPYKHFRDRSALLAAVAERDFIHLRSMFEDAVRRHKEEDRALRTALTAFIAYGLQHPARYRLLFSDPGLPEGGALTEAALASFAVFTRIVAACQKKRLLPEDDPILLAGLIYAAAHGAIDLQIGNRASGEKGLASAKDPVELLLRLLVTAAADSP